MAGIRSQVSPFARGRQNPQIRVRIAGDKLSPSERPLHPDSSGRREARQRFFRPIKKLPIARFGLGYLSNTFYLSSLVCSPALRISSPSSLTARSLFSAGTNRWS